MNTITISRSKVTSVAYWRAMSRFNWRTSVARFVKDHQSPQFILRADGSGTLFFPDGDKVRRKTWRQVRVCDTARALTEGGAK